MWDANIHQSLLVQVGLVDTIFPVLCTEFDIFSVWRRRRASMFYLA
jgi:hypothetical protein